MATDSRHAGHGFTVGIDVDANTGDWTQEEVVEVLKEALKSHANELYDYRKFDIVKALLAGTFSTMGLRTK